MTNTHTTAALKKLIVWARDNNISETNIPSCVDTLVSLEKLSLYNLNLSNLPDEIGALKNLKELYLPSNRFEKIPNVVYSLKNLEVLWVHDNCISEIPQEILQLVNLRELVAFSNNIVEIPNLWELQKLNYLVLSYNRLSKEIVHKFEVEFKGDFCAIEQKEIDLFYVEPLSNATLEKASAL